MENKRGQQAIGMSFGMMFAIFLIIVFVVIAFIAVNSFLDLGGSASVGLFYDELQETVNDALRSQESNRNFVLNLPSGVEKICFGNLSASITNPGEDYDSIRDYEVYDANTFLLPPEKASGMQWKEIDRIDIAKITETKNPYCVDVDVGLMIRKEFYDRLVWIE
jgi:hypothetical protein